MKINQRGITITEVPGFREICVEPCEHSVSGVHIVLDDGMEPDDIGGSGRRSFGISEARELRDALTAAIDHAERVIDSPATTESNYGPVVIESLPGGES